MRSYQAYQVRSLIGLMVTCMLVLLSADPLWSQTRIYHPSFVIDRWGTEDGLPVNNVLRIQQTQDGYLWFVTFDGLVRFDGLHFKVYQTETYPNLPTNRLTNVQEAEDGSLWIETEQYFLVRFRDGEFRRIGPDDGLNGTLCYQLSKGPEGNIWFGTDRGISVYDGTELKPFEPDIIQGNIHRIFVQKSGVIWYMDRTTRDVYRYQHGETKQIFTAQGDFEFYPLYESDSGTVWIASDNDVYMYENGALSPCCSSGFIQRRDTLAFENSIESENIRLPYHEFDNGFYFGPVANHYKPGIGEIYSREKSFFADEEGKEWTFTRFSISYDGEPALEDRINSYLFDREGNLWAGTFRDGLYRIKPNPFTIFSSNEGLPVNNVYPVLEDREGTIWAGLFGPRVARIKNGMVEAGPDFEHDEDVLSLQSLLQKKDGTLLAGVIHDGYFELKPGNDRFTKAQEPAGIENATVYAMHQQANGDLWLGTGNGLFRQQKNNWQTFNAENGFTNFAARYFLEAPDGSLWIATNGAGIARFSNGNFEMFSSKEGLGSDLVRSLFIEPESDSSYAEHASTEASEDRAMENRPAYSKASEDRPDDYVMWVGTEDIGLIRLEVKNGRPDFTSITRYARAEGMLDYIIHIILIDENNNFWFNTNRGIFTVSKEQLEAFHRGEIESIRGISYTESDGLLNREGNGGMQPAGMIASDGNIWLPGQGGITVFDPADIIANDFIPPVRIEELRTPDQTPVRTGAGNSAIELSANQRDFEVEFTSLSLVDPVKNRFRYRLKGYNDDWIDAGNRRRVSYTNIPAGRYTFEVMGSNNTEMWNPEPAVRAIVIAPYFYETSWFRILMVFFIFLVIYAGIRLRVRALKQNEVKLKLLVENRTEQLRTEKRKTEKQAERLKQLDQAKTRFFTNISHEFRTPLTLIISPLKRILSNGAEKFDSPTQKELNRMLRNSNRLMRLMDQTLELTRIERGKLKLHVRQIELNGFLTDITDLFMSVCEEKNIELSFNGHSDSLPVFADPDRLDKIAGNLLSNAIKFTPPGGRIWMKTKEEGDTIVVTVTDTGIGISEEEQKHIFDRFFQADSSETRYHEGSGIGLALAHDFAKLHQGDLTVKSAPGEGATFTLRLKKGHSHFSAGEFEQDDRDYVIGSVYHDDRTTYEPGENGRKDKDIDTDVDQTTVLIVEDNSDVRAFLQEELSGTYHVLEAANGAEALDIVAENLPDLIIADIMMPEVDGITFNKKLKEDPLTASIPVIFLTAKAAKENHLEGLEVGADDYITKPFDPDILKARVQNLIESRYRLRNLLLSREHQKDSPETSKESFGDPFLNKVEEILHAHYADPDFKVQDLADQLHMDRSQVLRKLKKRTGLATGNYIKKYRMEQASRLLRDEAGTITEVAYAVGYKSLSYFSYAFKEYYEMSPSEYIEQYKTEEDNH